MNTLEFVAKKNRNEKITMVTCYDNWSAKILNTTSVDSLLVGDSLAMIVYGHPTTLPASVEMMARHTEAVVRGAPNKLIVADMPFLSFRKGLTPAMNAVEQLMKAGAAAVKLEGVDGHEKVVEHIVKSGVPVMGHLGLTPQSFHGLGGFKVQGKEEKSQQQIVNQAMKLQDLGAFSLVLECVPAALAKQISQKLDIPCIGIGAGKEVDGQVLVLQDLLGMSDFKPKFLRHFMSGKESLQNAVDKYVNSVNKGEFPNASESY